MKPEEETLRGPHGEIIEAKLAAANKRIDDLEELVYGLKIAMAGFAHRGSEMLQKFNESEFTTDHEHIEEVLWAIKTCYPDD